MSIKEIKNCGWGLGIGDWAQSPNPQSPIPNKPYLLTTFQLMDNWLNINNVYSVDISNPFDNGAFGSIHLAKIIKTQEEIVAKIVEH